MPDDFQNRYLRNEPEFVERTVPDTSPLLDELQKRTQINVYTTNSQTPHTNTLLAEYVALKEILITVSQRNEQLNANCNLLIAQLQHANFQLSQLDTTCERCRYFQDINITNQEIIQNTITSDKAL